MNPSPCQKKLTRRKFLGSAGAAGLWLSTESASLSLAQDARPEWISGPIQHLIPMVNDHRIRLKCSLSEPLTRAPILRVDGRESRGSRSDSEGRFWRFDVADLQPATTYELQMYDGGGSPLCEAWPLKTFPAPDQEVEGLRILIYTCGGGDESLEFMGRRGFLAMNLRRALLKRALSFQPDVAIGIGDQIYWDQATLFRKPYGKLVRQFYARYGLFDPALPILGQENENVLKRVAERQIVQQYGVDFRSTPLFLTQDDHDFLENDDADEEIVSFPPDRFMRQAARATQHLYYPEFLADPTRPAFFEDAKAPDRDGDLAEQFGTLRYGRLLEALFYNCKSHLSLKGSRGGFMPGEVETWLHDRTKHDDTVHVMHVPSTPFVWSAGKWLEWYPDVMQPGGALGVNEEKYLWQSGWCAQHQRILQSLSERERGKPLIAQGDLHALGRAQIHRSGDLDLSANPVHVALTGPIGTGDLGFPSAFRATPPLVASGLEVETPLPALEKNGFTIMDVNPDGVAMRFFAWRDPDPAEAIAGLEPLHEATI